MADFPPPNSFYPYLFPPRAPSEERWLRRANADDPIADFVPQESYALIGVRKFNPFDALVIKMAYRENLDTRRILKRLCLYDS